MTRRQLPQPYHKCQGRARTRTHDNRALRPPHALPPRQARAPPSSFASTTARPRAHRRPPRGSGRVRAGAAGVPRGGAGGRDARVEGKARGRPRGLDGRAGGLWLARRRGRIMGWWRWVWCAGAVTGGVVAAARVRGFWGVAGQGVSGPCSDVCKSRATRGGAGVFASRVGGAGLYYCRLLAEVSMNWTAWMEWTMRTVGAAFRR